MIYHSSRMDRGLTLLEILIVLAVVLLLASLAVPSLRRAHRMADEASTRDQLRQLVQAQETFRIAVVVDQDEDGIGEFGFFPELTALVPGRTDGGFLGPRPDPPLLPQPIGVTDGEGHSSRGGYLFSVYLPIEEGAIAYTHDLKGGDRRHANFQESQWIAYAWPADPKETGLRSFSIGPRGRIYSLPPSIRQVSHTVAPGAFDCPAAFQPRPSKNEVLKNPQVMDPEEENSGRWILEK